ncbi:MAG: hypothetical protein IJF84_06165 [Thermoguttaceae bacterium]|nr:hypothetical protein [Thermoguttaceae bacterium]
MKRFKVRIEIAVFIAVLLLTALVCPAFAQFGGFEASQFEEPQNAADLTEMRQQIEDVTIPYQERLAVANKVKEITGRLPWTPMTSKEWNQRLYEQKATVKRYQAAFPKLRCSETRYFLFASDVPPQMYREIQALLDRMYGVLCDKFNVPFVDPQQEQEGAPAVEKRNASKSKPVRKNIWQAKCVVVVFMDESDYNQFETRFFNQKVSSGTKGLCHQMLDGTVTITCKFNKDKFNMYSSLVHETTHGFSFMRRVAYPLPLWLNEGVSDWTARTLVPQATTCPAKQKQAVAAMQKTHSLGGMFQATDHLDPWQYGAAAMTVNLLLKRNPGAFVNLIDDVKDGADVEQTLIKYYNLDFAALANLLGRACGIPGVKP